MTPGISPVFGLLFIIALAMHTQAGKPPPGPDENPEMAKLVDEAYALAMAKKPQAAIAKCDKVIAAYKADYGNRKEKIYCAHTSTESLGYLVMASGGLPGTSGKGYNAIVLSSTWSDAYYLRGFALVDLGKRSEAKSALERAIALSPWYSHYLNEIGQIYGLEKNWSKAMDVFKAAEARADLAPDNVKADDLGRARRGQGYVLVELGRLDEAEKKYKQCLATNPKDTKAAQELEYVRGLRAKTKSH